MPRLSAFLMTRSKLCVVLLIMWTMSLFMFQRLVSDTVDLLNRHAGEIGHITKATQVPPRPDHDGDQNPRKSGHIIKDNKTPHSQFPGELMSFSDISRGGNQYAKARNHRHKEKVTEEDPVARWLRMRDERLQSVCKKYNPLPNLLTTLYYRVFFFHDYNTTICTIAKAGSSTWRSHLRKVNGGPPRSIPAEKDVRRIEKLAQPESKLIQDINASSTIITVRHPLIRLVSTYRQKYYKGVMIPYDPVRDRERLEKRLPGASWSARIHQFWIPALHTNNLLPPDLHLTLGLDAPFSPNMTYSTDVYSRLQKTLKPRLTFTQFLRHVVATFSPGQRPDAHWSDINSECSPCYFHYQYVTKVESMSQDLEYIFKVLRIPATSSTVENQHTPNDGDYYAYYNEVPIEVRHQVYKCFKMDFEMFDYSLPDGFLDPKSTTENQRS